MWRRPKTLTSGKPRTGMTICWRLTRRRRASWKRRGLSYDGRRWRAGRSSRLPPSQGGVRPRRRAANLDERSASLLLHMAARCRRRRGDVRIAPRPLVEPDGPHCLRSDDRQPQGAGDRGPGEGAWRGSKYGSAFSEICGPKGPPCPREKARSATVTRAPPAGFEPATTGLEGREVFRRSATGSL